MDEIEARVRSEHGAILAEPRLVEGESQAAQGSLAEIWSKTYRARTLLLITFVQ